MSASLDIRLKRANKVYYEGVREHSIKTINVNWLFSYKNKEKILVRNFLIAVLQILY